MLATYAYLLCFQLTNTNLNENVKQKNFLCFYKGVQKSNKQVETS